MAWISGRYNTHQLLLSDGFELSVCWSATRSRDSAEPPWKVSVMGRDGGSYADIELAKKMAVVQAKKIIKRLAESLKEIDQLG